MGKALYYDALTPEVLASAWSRDDLASTGVLSMNWTAAAKMINVTAETSVLTGGQTYTVDVIASSGVTNPYPAYIRPSTPTASYPFSITIPKFYAIFVPFR